MAVCPAPQAFAPVAKTLPSGRNTAGPTSNEAKICPPQTSQHRRGWNRTSHSGRWDCGDKPRITPSSVHASATAAADVTDWEAQSKLLYSTANRKTSLLRYLAFAWLKLQLAHWPLTIPVPSGKRRSARLDQRPTLHGLRARWTRG